jgi:hypothetical protein
MSEQISTESTLPEQPSASVPAPPPLVDPNGIDRLNAAFAAAQGEFPAIPKNKTARVKMRAEKGGGEYTYKYADLAEVLSACTPALSKHGLSIRQPLKRIQGLLFLVTELHHASGQYATDDGLKIHENGSPQEMGSELTYMRRYAACCMLGVSPDADEDGKIATDAAKDRNLEGARARTAPATAAAKAATGATPKEVAAAANAAGGVITEDQRKQLNAERKKSGYSDEQFKSYFAGVGFGPKSLPVELFAAALRWAQTPAPAIDTKAETDPDEAKSLAELGQDAEAIPGMIGFAQKSAFWDMCRKHRKTDGEIARFLKERFDIESTANMPKDGYVDALKWASSPIDDGPPQSEDEKNARQGFGILGLNLAEQSALVDDLKGDWKEISSRLNTEIERRDVEQA